MVDPYQAFREQLASHELSLPDTHKLAVDGVIQRFGTTAQPNKKNAWYILFEFTLDSGVTVLAGTFGSWATGLKVNVDMTMSGNDFGNTFSSYGENVNRHADPTWK